MTWTPDDALVEKAARAMWETFKGDVTWENGDDAVREVYLDEARAALLACRDDMVAEAVKAEAEACAASVEQDARRVYVTWQTSGHEHHKTAYHELIETADRLRARHP